MKRSRVTRVKKTNSNRQGVGSTSGTRNLWHFSPLDFFEMSLIKTCPLSVVHCKCCHHSVHCSTDNSFEHRDLVLWNIQLYLAWMHRKFDPNICERIFEKKLPL